MYFRRYVVQLQHVYISMFGTIQCTTLFHLYMYIIPHSAILTTKFSFPRMCVLVSCMCNPFLPTSALALWRSLYSEEGSHLIDQVIQDNQSMSEFHTKAGLCQPGNGGPGSGIGHGLLPVHHVRSPCLHECVQCPPGQDLVHCD